ncbi:hypothetical protein cu1888 [Corynebacterium urealyticum DSM 7109]|uniref:Uncharacterized protein n=2 Tax=Corynebacterium urealyticum TaxID=43771 RepID=B1VI47_CORU7|nr:ABC transporter permease [Corynebacterium urealyticum]QQC42961.1 ABC transporter permease [Corynebacterium urealyticum]TYR18774.1 ABC transporter permease [Corynebacterium urealyticum]CAQ05847.1 hypothetical protein cu1888 [Corynebacterium urealyticum DSM 7109]SNV91670.1 ABC-2 family transporter protein [Corynebacterium urealyticum]
MANPYNQDPTDPAAGPDATGPANADRAATTDSAAATDGNAAVNGDVPVGDVAAQGTTSDVAAQGTAADGTVADGATPVNGAAPADDTADGTVPGEGQGQNKPAGPMALSIGTAIMSIAAIAVIFLTFLWPAQNAEPQNIPVGIAASEKTFNELDSQMKEVAEQNQLTVPFQMERYEDASAARTAVKNNEVQGALVIPDEPGQVRALLASANGLEPSRSIAEFAQEVNQLPAQRAQLEGKQPSQEVMQAAMAGPDIQDLVPMSQQEQQGKTLGKMTLPLVFAGLLLGLASVGLLRGAQQRVLTLLAGSVLGGLIAAVVTVLTVGYVDGNLVSLWLSFALGILAISAPVAGLGALLGGYGAWIGVAIPVLAYPLSGAIEPREFLGGLGSLGEFLAPGAVTTLNKLLVHFPDAALWKPLLALLAWSVLGIALIAVGQLRDQQEATEVTGADIQDPAALGNGESTAGATNGALTESGALTETGAAVHGTPQSVAGEGINNPAEGPTNTERG